jgi:hypothetical protein
VRLSPEKVLHLAGLVAERLERADDHETEGVTLKVETKAVRLRALEAIRAFLRRDEQIVESARQRIRSMARKVPEGSPEWDRLFRQHYDAELDRLRKVK